MYGNVDFIFFCMLLYGENVQIDKNIQFNADSFSGQLFSFLKKNDHFCHCYRYQRPRLAMWRLCKVYINC